MEKTLYIAIASAALVSSACSEDAVNEPTDGVMGGSSGQMQGGAGGEVNASGGSSGNVSGGSGGSSGFMARGACGQRGEATVVSTTAFEGGWEEYYLIGDRGFGDELCVVRFPVRHLGAGVAPDAGAATDAGDAGDAGIAPPPGCVDCLWTHTVGFGTPEVLADVDGVCANSELGLTSARMSEITSSTASYGYVFEFSGHNSVLLKYQEATQTWEPSGNANWDPETNAFRFDNRTGSCGYGVTPP